MSSPSPSAVAAIRAHVADWTQPTAAILAALNAPSVANPATQATVPRPFTTADLMATLDAPTLGKIMDLPSLARLLSDIEAQLPAPLGNWTMLLVAGGTISAAQASALMAVVTATHPDPAYAVQISWAVANLGRPVDLDDVIASRPQGA